MSPDSACVTGAHIRSVGIAPMRSMVEGSENMTKRSLHKSPSLPGRSVRNYYPDNCRYLGQQPYSR